MYKIIDTEKWNRKTQYEWFNSFSNPCYGIDIELDVTRIVQYSKASHTSFFINFLYLMMCSLNSIEEMRLRIVGNEVRLYDVIHPTYTVMTKLEVFDNCKNLMYDSYPHFYQACQKEVERAKNECSIQPGYNDEESYNVYYITCLPWLTYAGMTHPIPNGNKESCSVPRICFGRFEEKNKRYIMPFNLTVSHALVDGFPCSKALNTLKENCLRSEEFYIKN